LVVPDKKVQAPLSQYLPPALSRFRDIKGGYLTQRIVAAAQCLNQLLEHKLEIRIANPL